MQVEGEEPPKWGRMLVVDGNNSLKRLATPKSRQVGDTRVFSNDLFLPREFVDAFANEVKSRQAQHHVAVPTLRTVPEASDSEDNTLEEADPTDSVVGNSPCATNWKAAAADEKKCTWAIFDETGIFACACAHGMIAWLVDMVRSGEL